MPLPGMMKMVVTPGRRVGVREDGREIHRQPHRALRRRGLSRPGRPCVPLARLELPLQPDLLDAHALQRRSVRAEDITRLKPASSQKRKRAFGRQVRTRPTPRYSPRPPGLRGPLSHSARPGALAPVVIWQHLQVQISPSVGGRTRDHGSGRSRRRQPRQVLARTGSNWGSAKLDGFPPDRLPACRRRALRPWRPVAPTDRRPGWRRHAMSDDGADVLAGRGSDGICWSW